MRIVYFYDAIARFGGTERILIDKMNYLANQYKQEVYLITTCQGNHPFAFPLSKKIRHTDLSVRFHTQYRYSLPKRVYMIWKMNKELTAKLQKTVNDINPDIVIATTYYAADIVCNLNCKAKKIIESHVAKIYNGVNDGTQRNIISKIYRKWKFNKYFNTIKRKCDIIVTLTNGDGKDWKTNKTITIPNVIDIHNTTHSSQINKTAMFAGRFSYQKGLDRMLYAWKIVINKQKDWILKLVGDGELKEQLIDQCKKLGIEKNVIFKEATKDIASEYINSSLFLFTSRFEGFGLVLVEAMQCGVPCISFDCPYGPYDIIDNGENGYLVEDGNIEAFANYVLKLIENDELRKDMGKAAIEKSKQYLSKEIMPQWINLFEKLTAKV